jgi:acetyltransferase-like isoleucine patch superfamily enzyme
MRAHRPFSGVSDHAYVFPGVELGRNVTVFPGAVLGRPPVSSGAARQSDAAALPPLSIGDDCVIGSNAVIYAGSRIGRGTMVCDTACIRERVVIGELCLVAMGVTINCDVRIGSRVKLMDSAHITSNVLVEDDVFIGMLVSTTNDNDMGRGGQAMHEMIGPTIRRGARIGAGACLLPGVEIGRAAVVGANSVVTRSVPAQSLAVGVPAMIRGPLNSAP